MKIVKDKGKDLHCTTINMKEPITWGPSIHQSSSCSLTDKNHVTRQLSVPLNIQSTSPVSWSGSFFYTGTSPGHMKGENLLDLLRDGAGLKAFVTYEWSVEDTRYRYVYVYVYQHEFDTQAKMKSGVSIEKKEAYLRRIRILKVVWWRLISHHHSLRLI